MSLNTLTHEAFYAIPDGVSLQVEESRRNRSSAYAVGLMLFLVFAPMTAMHIVCRITASMSDAADMTVHTTAQTVQPKQG